MICARVFFHLSDSEPIFAASAVVACAAGGDGSARWPGATFKLSRLVAPGQRDERRHGQTHFVLGAKLGRDGLAAGLCFSSRRDSTRQRGGSCKPNCPPTKPKCHFSRTDPFMRAMPTPSQTNGKCQSLLMIVWTDPFSSASAVVACSCRWWRLGAMTGRDIQTSFVPSLPDSVTNDATGRLTLLLGRSWGVMAWRLAFVFQQPT